MTWPSTLAGAYAQPGLTTEQFRAYALTFWKVGLINEKQFDALMAEHAAQTGRTWQKAIQDLEAELRQS